MYLLIRNRRLVQFSFISLFKVIYLVVRIKVCKGIIVMESDESRCSTPSKKRKYKQNYRTEWENKFPWLTSLENRAKCKVCNELMASDLTVIKNHQNSRKHTEKCKGINKNQPKIDTFTQNSKTTKLERQVSIAEIKLAGFIAEHNLSFLCVDHLTDLLKQIFPDSEIAQKIQLKKTKTTCITSNVIEKTQKKNLAEKLKATKFSVLIDEATDISCIKTLCIVVRYFDNDEKKITSKFWNLRQLINEPGDNNHRATAEKIYEAVLESFREMNVPFKNIIGFASDGCNTMMGKKSSVSARMLHDFPGVTIQKCICHSLHLVASEACKALPRRCEDMARDIYNYFKSSYKRRSEFKDFQMFCETEPHVILRPAQTRWLSLLEVVKRINEQWSALTLYFTDKRYDAQLVSAETVYSSLHDPQIKLFYAFLEWVLTKIVSVNAYFQSEKVVIADTYYKMAALYKDLLKSYLNSNSTYVEATPIDKINPEQENEFIYLNNIYLGIKVMNLLDKSSARDMKQDFLKRCRQFLISCCQQIKARYDFSNNLLHLIGNLQPGKVLNKNNRLQSLYEIMKLSPRIVNLENPDLVQTADDEWRNIINYYEDLEHLINDEIDEFWYKLSIMRDGNDMLLFKNVAEFCLNILATPHSNATCERVFSKINLIKVKTRNKLITSTINGLLLSSDYIKAAGNCVKFNPDEKMLCYMRNSTVLYKNQKDLNENDCEEVCNEVEVLVV